MLYTVKIVAGSMQVIVVKHIFPKYRRI